MALPRFACASAFAPPCRLESIALKPCWQQVVETLVPAFDDLDLASWFARPNAWLAGACPADAIAGDLPAVVRAARADRFIVLG